MIRNTYISMGDGVGVQVFPANFSNFEATP